VHLLLEPIAWLLVLLFSLLGVIGNLALYRLGKGGIEAVQSRFSRIKPEKWQRAQELYEKRGSWILVISGIPVVGLTLTTVAGAFGVRIVPFVIWVMIGKLLRNWLLVVIIAQTGKALTG
jgi:membrane protein YqaA with SNARE-associated domain